MHVRHGLPNPYVVVPRVVLKAIPTHYPWNTTVMVFSRGRAVQASIHTSSIHLTYRFKMWGIWQWATWLYTSTWIRYTVPLSGSVSRVSQPLNSTCTTIEDESERRVLQGKRTYRRIHHTRVSSMRVCHMSHTACGIHQHRLWVKATVLSPQSITGISLPWAVGTDAMDGDAVVGMHGNGPFQHLILVQMPTTVIAY